MTSLSGKSTTGTKIRAGVFSSKYFSRYSCSPKIETKQLMTTCLIVSYLLRMISKYFSENYCGVAINKRKWNAALKFSLYIEGKSPTSLIEINFRCCLRPEFRKTVKCIFLNLEWVSGLLITDTENWTRVVVEILKGQLKFRSL